MRFFSLFSSILVFTVSPFLLSLSFATSDSEEWNTGNIRLKHDYQHIVLKNAGQFVVQKEVSLHDDDFCVAEGISEKNQNDENNESTQSIDISAIEKYLTETVAPVINQDKENVTISKDENGNIVFDGFAKEGAMLDIPESAKLIEQAIQNNVYYVTLPVDSTAPTVTVTDDELKTMGIEELVSVGRSDFNGSSSNRIHNVMTGSSKFNGYIVPQGEVFSFTDQLGAINASTGYVKELVILGNKVLPDYGGGLCQVSSTAYRAAMVGGLEILERHNHSYAVGYYEPYGSDATIYVGHKDFKFRNTTDGALLIQTSRGGANNNELFFNYYGTKPERTVQIFGPLTQNYRSPPATKVTYDSSKPAGYAQTVSHRVTGFDAQFFRSVQENGEELYDDTFYSPYQARGTWVIRGGSPEPTAE